MYYANHNLTNFLNYWDIFAFSIKKERDQFVEQESDRLLTNGNRAQSNAIKRTEVSGYFESKPFSGLCLYIDWSEPAFIDGEPTGGRIVQECSYEGDYNTDFQRFNKK